MKKTIALILAGLLCVSVTACGTGSTEVATIQEQKQPAGEPEEAAIQEDPSDISETDDASDVKVAKDGADMQTEDKSMPTRIPMEGGSMIFLGKPLYLSSHMREVQMGQMRERRWRFTPQMQR